jgi:hypothetical protein
MFENLGRPRCRTSGDFFVIGGGYPNCIPVFIPGFVVGIEVVVCLPRPRSPAPIVLSYGSPSATSSAL